MALMPQRMAPAACVCVDEPHPKFESSLTRIEAPSTWVIERMLRVAFRSSPNT